MKFDSSNDLDPMFQKLKNKSIAFQIVGTSAKTNSLLDDESFMKATFFIIGNETSGMNQNYKELCDFCIKIPMYGNASSFNVACASSIVLYEIDRQRRKCFDIFK